MGDSAGEEVRELVVSRQIDSKVVVGPAAAPLDPKLAPEHEDPGPADRAQLVRRRTGMKVEQLTREEFVPVAGRVVGGTAGVAHILPVQIVPAVPAAEGGWARTGWASAHTAARAFESVLLGLAEPVSVSRKDWRIVA